MTTLFPVVQLECIQRATSEYSKPYIPSPAMRRLSYRIIMWLQ